jgi:aromatic-L-amino-acid/L-tryptophan decarboxylase
MTTTAYRASLTTKDYSQEPSPFDMDAETFRQLALIILDVAVEHLNTIDHTDRKAYQPVPERARALLQSLDLPEDGWNEEDILAFYFRNVLPYQRAQNVPTFAAFVDPAASPISMLAAFLAAVCNNSATGGNYATAYVEQTAIRWLMELIGIPVEGSDGVFLHGGSDANRHGMEVARYWGASQYGWNVREEGLIDHARLVMYCTPEAHSCIYKNAQTLGLGQPHEIPVDRHYRMDVQALRQAIKADRAHGNLAFLIVANAGTVRMGAIDPLDAIADVCAEENLWMHVDGAFGGLGAVDPRLASYYTGIERADSVAIDPHKWLAAAISCSAVLIGNGRGPWLQATYKLVPDYLRFSSGNTFADGPWYSHRSAAQTRDSAPALKTFWNILAAGRAGIEKHVARHVDLARYMEHLIERSPDLELIATGPLPAVCFRYVPAQLVGQEQALNELNLALMARMQVEGRAFLAGVQFSSHEEELGACEREGRYALRSCALHYALTETHIETILNEVRRVGELCLTGMR